MSKKLISIANTFSINASYLFDGEGILNNLTNEQGYDVYELVYRTRVKPTKVNSAPILNSNLPSTIFFTKNISSSYNFSQHVDGFNLKFYTSNNIPSGMVLNSNGTLYGVPSQSNNSVFTVTSNNAFGSVSFPVRTIVQHTPDAFTSSMWGITKLNSNVRLDISSYPNSNYSSIISLKYRIGSNTALSFPVSNTIFTTSNISIQIAATNSIGDGPWSDIKMGIPIQALDNSFILNDSQWVISEALEDINTRKLQILIAANTIPSTHEPLWYRGKNLDGIPTSGSFGSFTKQLDSTWTAQASVATALNSFDYVRIFKAPANVSKPVSYLEYQNANSNVTIASSIKTFTPSNIPDPVNLSYITSGDNNATVYLDPPKWNGRIGTGGRYRFDSSNTYTTFLGSGPLLFSNLNNPTLFGVQYTNANGNSLENSLLIYSSPPFYDDTDFYISNTVTDSGDTITINVNNLTIPQELTFIGTQYTFNNGLTFNDLLNPKISGLIPDQEINVKIRAVYETGTSKWSNGKLVTPKYPTVTTSYGVMSTPVKTTKSLSSTVHVANLPSYESGNLLDVFAMFKGVPNSIIINESNWSDPVKITTNEQTSFSIWRTTKTALANTEHTITFNTDTSINSSIWSLRFDGIRDSIISPTAHAEATSFPLNVVQTTFQKTEKAIFMLFFGHLGSSTPLTGAPSIDSSNVAWSSIIDATSSTSSNGVRLNYVTKQAEVNYMDPNAWPDSRQQSASFMVSYLPASSVPPINTVNVILSANNIEQGDSITWTATSDGRAPKTYSLTVDGITETNNNGIFTRTPSSSASLWSITATNVNSSKTVTGTINVSKNLVVQHSDTNVYILNVQADSISYNLIASSYEVEYGKTSNTITQSIIQSSPYIQINFTENDAYKIRARCIDINGNRSNWSDYSYYAPWVDGEISWPIYNAQKVEKGSLAVNDLIQVQPVTGRNIKLYEPLPKITYETWNGYINKSNGTMINPYSSTGLDPQGWDDRQGSQDNIRGIPRAPEYFYDSLMQKTWPISVPLETTVSKVKSRPTSQLKAGNPTTNSGYRAGLIDKHSGIIVTNNFTTSTPIMQSQPSLIKRPNWSTNLINLPNFYNMVDLLATKNFSTNVTGFSSIDPNFYYNAAIRFSPAMMLKRGGTYWKDSPEPFIPFNEFPTWGDSNYYDYQLDEVVCCLLISNGWNIDKKREILASLIQRGINMDYPGVNFRVGAGVNQRSLLPLALYRTAAGIDFKTDLSTDQFENIPVQYGYWNNTTLSYLNSHSDPVNKPLFALQRQISEVLAPNADGYCILTPWGNLIGERKQRFRDLIFVRMSTGEELVVNGYCDTDQSSVYSSTDRSTENTSTGLGLTGTLSTPLEVGEWFYLKIPPAAMVGFQANLPYWSYGVNVDVSPPTSDWRIFNPTPDAAYRSINEPHGRIMLLTALNAWPTDIGSSWAACKDYTIKSSTGIWPTPTFKYGSTASAALRGFWNAYSSSLGLI